MNIGVFAMFLLRNQPGVVQRMCFSIYFHKIAEENRLMNWDKFKIAQKFLQKANAMHPEDTERSDLHDRSLALQDVYYDCYMSSFTRDDLLKRLHDIIAGKIEMPEEQKVDEVKYRETYVREAKGILSSIENGEFKW